MMRCTPETAAAMKRQELANSASLTASSAKTVSTRTIQISRIKLKHFRFIVTVAPKSLKLGDILTQKCKAMHHKNSCLQQLRLKLVHV